MDLWAQGTRLLWPHQFQIMTWASFFWSRKSLRLSECKVGNLSLSWRNNQEFVAIFTTTHKVVRILCCWLLLLGVLPLEAWLRKPCSYLLPPEGDSLESREIICFFQFIFIMLLPVAVVLKYLILQGYLTLSFWQETFWVVTASGEVCCWHLQDRGEGCC